MHARVIGLIDSEFLPRAQNADLRGDIIRTRGAVEDHLRAAQALQAQLGAPDGADGGTADGGTADGGRHDGGSRGDGGR